MKRIIVITLIYIIPLLHSCVQDCNDVRFYDFSGIELITPRPNIAEGDSMVFYVREIDVSYLASEIIGNTALATSCDTGWDGPKHMIEEFELISNADFDSMHLAGTSLNDLVMVSVPDDNFEFFSNIPLEMTDVTKHLRATMYITQSPTIDLRHQLTLQILKSNGVSHQASTESIRWE
jgi:hypothetical protein